jgi:hypothetical protein
MDAESIAGDGIRLLFSHYTVLADKEIISVGPFFYFLLGGFYYHFPVETIAFDSTK